MTKSIVSEKTLNQYSRYSFFIDKSTEFVNSIASDTNLELVTSILFILKSEKLNQNAIVERIQSWTDRKAAIFSSEIIASAIDDLLQYPLIQVDLEGKYSTISKLH